VTVCGVRQASRAHAALDHAQDVLGVEAAVSQVAVSDR
jgi:hypothetical protein